MFVIEYQNNLYFFQNYNDPHSSLFGQKIKNGTYVREYRVPKEEMKVETTVKYIVMMNKKKITNSHHALHSINDNPARIDFENYRLEWYSEGRLHRDGDKPAVVTFTEDGCLLSLEWYYAGRQHRDGNRPAVIVYQHKDNCETPKKLYREWWLNGVKQNKPAYKPEKVDFYLDFEYINHKDLVRCVRKISKDLRITPEYAASIILRYNPLPLDEYYDLESESDSLHSLRSINNSPEDSDSELKITFE
jgi:hypothetical protein